LLAPNELAVGFRQRTVLVPWMMCTYNCH